MPGPLPRATEWDPPYVEWVVKLSKFCNLRCRYCYEFTSLGDRTRMTLDEVERFFRHVTEYYRGSEKIMHFVWHGGEPLLAGPDFFSRLRDLQDKILTPAGLCYTNGIQTNLTFLNKRQLACLAQFDNVGVSIDLFGDQRVDARGRLSEARTIAGMQQLQDVDIKFGCITVLSQHTLPHVDAIYDFFEDIGVSTRFLPIYRTSYPGQQAPHAVSNSEIITAFKHLVNRWFTSAHPVSVQPISEFITIAVRSLVRPEIRVPDKKYDKLAAEILYIVDTNGDIYSNADAYDPLLSHGNILREPLARTRESAGYLRAVRAASRRMEQACPDCPHFGSCSGFFAAEATPEQQQLDDNGRHRCGVAREVISHIKAWVAGAGVLDERGYIDHSHLAEAAVTDAPYPGLSH